LVHFAIDLYPEEIYGDFEKAYGAGLVDPGCIGMEDVDRGLASDKEEALRALPEKHPLVTDAVQQMYWWACFKDDYRERQEKQAKLYAPAFAPTPAVTDPPEAQVERLPEAAPSPHSSSFLRTGTRRAAWIRAVETHHRGNGPRSVATIRAGCGSGKKYKKCCGKGGSMIRKKRRVFTGAPQEVPAGEGREEGGAVDCD